MKSLFLILILLFLSSPTQSAQRFIVPQSIGGSTDVAARILSRNMGDTVVHNKPGAGSVTGIEYAKRQEPNINFLVVASSYTLNTIFSTHVQYDPLGDFIPIKQFVQLPSVVVVNSHSSIKSIAEIIHNERLIFSHSGIGTSSFITTKLFMKSIGKEYLLVPYKGGTPAILSVLTKETDVNFASITTALPLIKTNQLRPIAITAKRKMYGIPTLNEVGIHDLKYMAWIGILAPQKTNKKVIADMEKRIDNILIKDDVIIEFENYGMEILNQTKKDFHENIKSEMRKWKAIDGL